MSTERHHNSQFAAALSESKHLWLRLPRTFSSSLVEPRVRTGLTFCVQVLGPKVRSCLTCDDVGCNVAAGACLTSPGFEFCLGEFRMLFAFSSLWSAALFVASGPACNAYRTESWKCVGTELLIMSVANKLGFYGAISEQISRWRSCST